MKDAGESLYRIRVVLDAQQVQGNGQPLRLRPGMRLDASLLLERRKFYEWIVEPLNGVAGKL
jgi:membrane fusion protein